MTHLDKLMIDEIQGFANLDGGILRTIGIQYMGLVRENERLLNAYKYGHSCLINVGFPNLAELMAITAGRHNGNKQSVTDREKYIDYHFQGDVPYKDYPLVAPYNPPKTPEDK